MGFEVVQQSDSIQPIWGPVKNTDTLYVGQLVRCNNEGFEPLAQASGAADQAHKVAAVGLIADGASANNLLFGVVIGTNAYSKTYNTTYMAESITYLAPSSAAYDAYVTVEGFHPKGDLVAMVQVMPITADTVLKGQLFNASFGTATTVQTITSGASTLGATSTDSSDAAGIASLSTAYFRTGAAAGVYRVTDDTSQTVLTWDLPTGGTPAVGDTLVRVNFRPQGLSVCQTDSEAMFFDTSAACTSHYFLIDVLGLDLREAGKECVYFRFNPYMFQTFDDLS